MGGQAISVPNDPEYREVVAEVNLPLLTLSLDGRPGSVRRARRAARNFLVDLRHEPGHGLDAQTTEDVVLVVAELTANACRHAPGPCRVSVAVAPEAVEVAVADTGRGLPHLKPEPDPAGYGLLAVAVLTRGIHVVTMTGGKVVRAAVPLPRRLPRARTATRPHGHGGGGGGAGDVSGVRTR